VAQLALRLQLLVAQPAAEPDAMFFARSVMVRISLVSRESSLLQGRPWKTTSTTGDQSEPLSEWIRETFEVKP
jgi:hypothetical protein